MKTISKATVDTALHVLAMRKSEVSGFVALEEKNGDKEGKEYWEMRLEQIVAAIKELSKMS